jgi:para-aminobenzoate synthetase component I
MAAAAGNGGAAHARSAPIALGKSPEAVFALFADEPYAAFLDSSAGGRGCRSYVCCRPRLVIRARGRDVEITAGGKCTRTREDPLEALRRVLPRAAVRGAGGGRGARGALGPFGGLVGYLGYELGGCIESLPMTRRDDLEAPDLWLCQYETILAFEHGSGTWRISTISRNGLAAERERILGLLRRAPAAASPPLAPSPRRRSALPPVECNFTRAEYLTAVRRALRHIREGDLYQVNLSQRFSAALPCAPWDLYRTLRRLNPAPYACYLKFPGMVLAGSSPELFLRVRGREVTTRPIKGTRPRGSTPAEDRAQREELSASAKDRAELAMIVDLERNDLGRVCSYGSVRVKEPSRLETFATVFHTTATVVGRLAPGRDLVDLLRASFPGGSITGCPKIRAMEIIDELEPTARGPYTGAMGYIGARGNAELNIAIRTIVLKDGRAYWQVGGGIVAGSDPAAEYRETLDKGRALVRALREAGTRQAGPS